MIYVVLIAYLTIILICLTGIQQSRHSDLSDKKTEFVSVIIAVKNEARLLPRCLSALARQSYPYDKFEIIVIDDHSTDETWSILQSYAVLYPCIRPIKVDRMDYKSSKKSALETGILMASGSLLLLTDADTLPPSGWIQSMVNRFAPHTGLVAGFSPQTVPDKPLWNNILFIDSLAAAFVSAATIGWGSGVTCTGRNLAYRKQAYMDVQGFSSTPDLLSGDDDFILRSIARHPVWQVTYTFERKSCVAAQGPSTLKTFWKQKRRHLSAGRSYSTTSRIGYGIYHGLNLILWSGLFWFPGILALTLKWIIDFAVLRWISQKPGGTPWVPAFALWECLFPIYHILLTPLSMWKTQSWKEPDTCLRP
jgi:cellulose synthase/poly-beta-1,6-N-acetylglucosamine synthase-like glycosyltransferase